MLKRQQKAGAAVAAPANVYGIRRQLRRQTELIRNVARNMAPMTHVGTDISFILPVHTLTIIKVMMPMPMPLEME